MYSQYKYIFTFIGLFFSTLLMANSVDIELDPARPVRNQEFNLIFNITTSIGQDEPFISFDAGVFEVKGKRLVGKQSNARLINGKFSTSSVYKYAYLLITDRVGDFVIRDIQVEVGGEKIRVPNKRISVALKQSEPQNFFLKAEPSKTKVYVGEGIDLNYYLYSRVQNVGRTEIEVFPKLNNFIKRFYMPQNERQTVEYEGVVYRRSLEYSARIYPERAGKLKIDQMRLKFQYNDYRNTRGLGAFGLAFGRPKIKSISSPDEYIQVENIPSAGVPPDFTTLVGDHDFKISINKNKFLVNEAIEVRLEVTGPGALENFAAPSLYQDSMLEKFDTKSELSEVTKSIGKKVFEYTYLARGPLQFKEKNMTFSYFDPNSKTFKTKAVLLPPIIVGGGQIKAQSYGGSDASPKKEEPVQKVTAQGDLSVISPRFEDMNEATKGQYPFYLKLLLILTLIGLGIEYFYRAFASSKVPGDIAELTKTLAKTGMSYSLLNKYIRGVASYSPVESRELTLHEIIDVMPVSDKCKKYFHDHIQMTENMEYKRDSRNYDKKFEMKYFKEMNSKL